MQEHATQACTYMYPRLHLPHIRTSPFFLRYVSASQAAQHQSALASFNDKYTAAKRLTIIPAPADPNATPRERIDGTPSATAGHNSREPHATADAGGNNGGGDGGGSSGIVVVEVQFSGPQPAERPALLLQNLLGGKSVAAHPVLLRRGRSKKPTEADAAAAGGRAGEGAGASVEVSRSTGKKRVRDVSYVRVL